jgi:Leucine-rich repeat (LRR) protein
VKASLVNFRDVKRSLVHIGVRTSLRELELSGTDVTDADLPPLAGLSHLENLRLAHTQITDAGLDALARLTWLRHLDLNHTDISNQGAATLRQRLPNTQIDHQEDPFRRVRALLRVRGWVRREEVRDMRPRPG